MKTTGWDDLKASWPDRDTPQYRSAYERARRELELGMRVRELRVAAGLSQSALAKRVGTSQPNIARLEAGGGMPRIDTLDRIAEALGAELVVTLQPADRQTS